MTSALYNIWICPKGMKTAAAASANPIASSYHLEPIDIAKEHFLLRYPIGPQNGLDGQPVKAARVNTQQEFTSPEKFDVFVQGDPVNAWRLAGSIINASTGLEVFLSRSTQQRAWRLGPRQDAAGVVWELDDAFDGMFDTLEFEFAKKIDLVRDGDRPKAWFASRRFVAAQVGRDIGSRPPLPVMRARSHRAENSGSHGIELLPGRFSAVLAKCAHVLIVAPAARQIASPMPKNTLPTPPTHRLAIFPLKANLLSFAGSIDSASVTGEPTWMAA